MEESEWERQCREKDAIIAEMKLSRLAWMRVVAICAAFWSGVLTVAALIGAWVESNSRAIGAGFEAFWEIWKGGS